MLPTITRRGLVPLALAAAALPRFAIAQPAWRPNRPVRIVVPFPPGGATDMLARLVAQGLGNRLGQPLVVENRPGGVGVVASQNVISAPADGHALIFATCDTHTIMPAANSRLPYNAADFVPVTSVATTVMALIARPGLGVTNLQQFLDRARSARPGLTYGSYGVATVSHAAGEMVKQAAGIDMTHVPYGGAAPAMLAVTADEVDCTIVPVAVGNPQRSRSVMIGVASNERFPLVPDVPTLAELGLPVVADAWIGLLAAPGTPLSIAESLHAAVAEVLATSAFAETLRTNGFSQQGYGPARFAEHLRAENARWGKIVRDAKITIEG